MITVVLIAAAATLAIAFEVRRRRLAQEATATLRRIDPAVVEAEVHQRLYSSGATAVERCGAVVERSPTVSDAGRAHQRRRRRRRRLPALPGL
jgi:hypothetical protein